MQKGTVRLAVCGKCVNVSIELVIERGRPYGPEPAVGRPKSTGCTNVVPGGMITIAVRFIVDKTIFTSPYVTAARSFRCVDLRPSSPATKTEPLAALVVKNERKVRMCGRRSYNTVMYAGAALIPAFTTYTYFVRLIRSLEERDACIYFRHLCLLIGRCSFRAALPPPTKSA